MVKKKKKKKKKEKRKKVQHRGLINLLCVLICIMNCHGNDKIRYNPNEVFFLRTVLFFHLEGPSGQFGTHEKLSWSCTEG